MTICYKISVIGQIQNIDYKAFHIIKYVTHKLMLRGYDLTEKLRIKHFLEFHNCLNFFYTNIWALEKMT